MPPSLLHLPSIEAYRIHFDEAFARRGIITHDDIRVSFMRNRFNHAFYESANRDGVKDIFSHVRAARMNWINSTLIDPAAVRYSGWNPRESSYTHTRAVHHLHEDFVVVVKFNLTGAGMLRANFITCYQADNSIDKIRTSPPWDKATCLTALRRRGGR